MAWSYQIRNLLFKLKASWQHLSANPCRNGRLAMHAMFKDEAPWLAEWLDWHFSQGVDHVFLTNDGSSDDYLAVLEPYLEAGLVSLEDSIAHPDFYHREQFHKNRILKDHSDQFQWIAFIDSDEFLYSEERLKVLLARLSQDSAGMVLNWMIYGTAHLERLAADATLLGSLVRRFPDGHQEHFQVKSIIATGHGAAFFHHNPHFPNYSPLAPLHWADGERFRPNDQRFLAQPAHLKHYWYRTEQYFREQKRDRRIFFEGKERRAALEDWHYRRSNAVLDPIPQAKLDELYQWQKAFKEGQG